MDYRERPPSERLTGLVKTFWTLDASGAGDSWIEQEATPDGCIEVILRLRGRSRWGNDQPARFIVGLNESRAAFEISGDSRFSAMRVWPWAWRAISGLSPRALYGRWIDAQCNRFDQIFAALKQPSQAEALLMKMLGEEGLSLRKIGLEILGAGSVAEMSRRTGMPPRQLQRWFTDHVGIAPRSYLRLLRFQTAFEELPNADLLADHAAQHGFADQAHMAREFRRLAGKAANQARYKSRGPFLT